MPYMQRITSFIQENRIFRFVISGGLAVLVNLSVLFFLTEFFHVYYLFSAVLSFSAGFFVTFFLQKFWTFQCDDVSKIPKQFGTTLVVAVSNLFLNTFLIFIFVETVHLWYMFAQVVASLLISFETYFLYKNVIFPQKQSFPLR
jgi:dolichol-phosphate mannosyltransferase